MSQKPDFGFLTHRKAAGIVLGISIGVEVDYFTFSSTHLRALMKASIHGVTSSVRREAG